MSEAKLSNQSEDEFGKQLESVKEAMEAGDTESATAAGLGLFAKLAEMPDRELTPSQQAGEEADHCVAKFNWAGAEAAYQRAVRLSGLEPVQQIMPSEKLCGFYLLLEMADLALPAAHLASEAAKRAEWRPLIVRSLIGESKLLLTSGNLDSAKALLEEAPSYIGEENAFGQERSSISIMWAFYHLEIGELEKAQEDLNAAWPSLEPWVKNKFFGGTLGKIAMWWGATARLSAKKHDLKGAVAAQKEVVALYRVIAQLPQSAGPYTRNGLARALNELGKAQEAANDAHEKYSFRESRAIRREIGLPPLGEPLSYPLA